MTFVDFEDSNCEFTVPTGAEGVIIPIKGHVLEFDDIPGMDPDVKVFTACAELDESEREEFLRTGKIYISVLGKGWPPMNIRINPFVG